MLAWCQRITRETSHTKSLGADSGLNGCIINVLLMILIPPELLRIPSYFVDTSKCLPRRRWTSSSLCSQRVSTTCVAKEQRGLFCAGFHNEAFQHAQLAPHRHKTHGASPIHMHISMKHTHTHTYTHTHTHTHCKLNEILNGAFFLSHLNLIRMSHTHNAAWKESIFLILWDGEWHLLLWIATLFKKIKKHIFSLYGVWKCNNFGRLNIFHADAPTDLHPAANGAAPGEPPWHEKR